MFSELARGYCDWCEDLRLGTGHEEEAASWLGRLYGHALTMPSAATDTADPPGLPAEVIMRARDGLACFDEAVYHLIDPDPHGKRETLAGIVSADLLAVYQGVKAGLLQYDAGNTDRASWHWGTRGRSHWGKDAVDGMRALHSLFIARNEKDRWKFSKTHLLMRKCEAEIALDPDDAFPYAQMGNWWHWKRHYLRALENFNTAIRLDPGLASARCGRANLLATCPEDRIRDGKTAVLDARIALDVANLRPTPRNDWRHRPYFIVLAAAYAEAGDFESAIKVQRDAFAFANTRTSQRDVEELLKMYESREPVRIERGLVRHGPMRNAD